MINAKKHWASTSTTTIPNQLIIDRNLDSYEFRILLFIHSFWYVDNILGKEKEFSINYLEKCLPISEKKIRNSLKALEEKGYIKKTKEYCSKTNSPACYKATFNVEYSIKKNDPLVRDTTPPLVRDTTPPLVRDTTKEITKKRINKEKKREAEKSAIIPSFKNSNNKIEEEIANRNTENIEYNRAKLNGKTNNDKTQVDKIKNEYRTNKCFLEDVNKAKKLIEGKLFVKEYFLQQALFNKKEDEIQKIFDNITFCLEVLDNSKNRSMAEAMLTKALKGEKDYSEKIIIERKNKEEKQKKNDLLYEKSQKNIEYDFICEFNIKHRQNLSFPQLELFQKKMNERLSIDRPDNSILDKYYDILEYELLCHFFNKKFHLKYKHY